VKDDFKEIESLIKSYHTIILSKKRMTKVKDEIILQKDKLKLLESKVEKEYSDVVRIENHPLRILFATILESEKRQFEKEKQEYLHAVLEYKECIKLIELLEYELEVLQTKSEDEKIVLKTIDDKLQSIDDIQISGDSIYLQELKTVNDELAQMLKLRVEIIDALELIQDIQNNFNAMISNLNRAKEMNTWGRYYREIQQAKQMKKSFIDEAHAYVHVIQKSLVYLQNEIHDVIVYQDFFRRTESFIRGFNLEYYHVSKFGNFEI